MFLIQNIEILVNADFIRLRADVAEWGAVCQKYESVSLEDPGLFDKIDNFIVKYRQNPNARSFLHIFYFAVTISTCLQFIAWGVEYIIRLLV